MKIRVISTNNKELELNQIAIRALFINLIIFNLFTIAAVLFSGKTYYLGVSLVLEGLSLIFIIVSCILVMFRNDGKGIHDIMAKTMVIKDN